jgi:hypothetical protein
MAVGADETALGDLDLNGFQSPSTHKRRRHIEFLGTWVDVIKIHALRRKVAPAVRAGAQLGSIQPEVAFWKFLFAPLTTVSLLVRSGFFWFALGVLRVSGDDASLTATPRSIEVGRDLGHITGHAGLHKQKIVTR